MASSTLPFDTEEQLSLLVWNTCNARCAHCGPESGPKDRTSLTHEKALELIAEAGRLYKPGWYLSLSGGEIFLYYDRLTAYVEAAKAAGGISTLITNCYWATSVDKAIEMLRPLIERGLVLLGVSADKFHGPYIPTSCVSNAIKAARKLGLSARLRSVASRSGRLSDVLLDIQDSEPWFVQFMEMPLVPDGRARSIPESELFLSDEFPTGRCPAASLTINPAGKGMACCNGGGTYKALHVGDVAIHTLEQLEYQFRTDPLVNYLQNIGPAGLLRFLPDDVQSQLKAKKYVNVCHLCIELFSDSIRGPELRTKLEAEFHEAAQRSMAELIASISTGHHSSAPNTEGAAQ